MALSHNNLKEKAFMKKLHLQKIARKFFKDNKFTQRHKRK